MYFQQQFAKQRAGVPIKVRVNVLCSICFGNVQFSCTTFQERVKLLIIEY